MNLLLLVAGEGARLRPHTLDRPKCLVPFIGKALLDWQIAVYDQFSFRQIVGVVGYKRTCLESYDSIRKVPNLNYATTNISTSLMLGLEAILNTAEKGDTIVVSYGDIIFHRDVFEKLYNDKRSFVTVIDQEYWPLWSARMENPLSDLESLNLSDDLKIESIGARPMSLQEIDGQYIGLTKFSLEVAERLLHLLRENRDNIQSLSITHLFDYLIQNGYFEISACVIKRGWVELDTVEDLVKLEPIWQEFIRPQDR